MIDEWTVRKLMVELARHVEWHRKRSLLPYDWEEYEGVSYEALIKELGINKDKL
jgi:hypothetical protein